MRVARTTSEAALGAALTLASVVVLMRGVAPAVPTPSGQPMERQSAGASRPYSEVEPAQDAALAAPEKLGAEFDADTSMPRHAKSVASYTLRARLDTDAHEVSAQGEIVWTNASRSSVGTLYVHAYLNAFKDDRSTFMKERSSGGRGSGQLRAPGRLEVRRFAARELGGEDLWPSAKRADPGNVDDETDLAITLPRAVAPGETVHVDVDFIAHLPWVVERSGHVDSFHMVAQWFPKIARLEPDGTFAHFPYRHLAEFYADFGDYDVTIDVPDGFEVGSTGRRVLDERSDGRHVQRYVQGDVHDFAFAAYDRFAVQDREVDGIALRCLAPRGYESVARQQLDAAEFGLREYSRSFGAYPYDTLTIVHPPPGAEEAGGMEYPTLITTGGVWYAPSQAGFARSLTLHELAHQYFYGLVATNEAKWPFLDEGLATYAELEALDAGWGDRALWSVGWSTGGTDGLLRYLGLPAGHDDVIAQPAASFVSWRSYGLLVYARTALVLRTLDRVYEPGATKRAVGRWARRYRYDHPGPPELIGAVRDVAGPDAARELRTALFEEGWVDYAVDDARCDDSGCRIVVTRRGSLSFPIDIDVIGTGGSVERVRWDGGGRQVVLRPESTRDISAVLIDPGHRVLLDEDLANNVLRTGSTPAASRVWERATYALMLAAHAVSP